MEEINIIEKLYQLLNIFNAEMKQCRDYGTGHLLYHSEVHLIMAIFNHKDANVSELAQALGITNGAVTQVADKLLEKGLIEKYKLKDDKRGTYFRLTEQGETVYYGHEKHHDDMQDEAMEYMESLDEDKAEVIITLVDKLIKKIPKT